VATRAGSVSAGVIAVMVCMCWCVTHSVQRACVCVVRALCVDDDADGDDNAHTTSRTVSDLEHDDVECVRRCIEGTDAAVLQVRGACVRTRMQ
jgi:hypothetical protein